LLDKLAANNSEMRRRKRFEFAGKDADRDVSPSRSLCFDDVQAAATNVSGLGGPSSVRPSFLSSESGI